MRTKNSKNIKLEDFGLTKEFVFEWIWVLSPSEEFTIYQKFFLNKTHKEIALMIKRHQETVRNKITRSIKKLLFIKKDINNMHIPSVYWRTFSGIKDKHAMYWKDYDPKIKFKKEQIKEL